MAAHRPLASHLQTPRLRMRPWADADVEDYRTLVAQRGTGTPSAEDVQQRIATQRAAMRSAGISLLVLQRRTEGDFIGYCGLIAGRSSASEPELAYELLRRVHGRGYATEAAEAVVRAATECGYTRLRATVRAWNAPSLRVLDKLGFACDHRTRDGRGELVWLTCPLPRDQPAGG